MKLRPKLAELPEHIESPNTSLYHSDNYIVLDFETTALNKGNPLDPDNRLVLSCWKHEQSDKVHHCFGSEYEQAALLEALDSADFVVAHNAKFELGWLRRCGVDLHDVISFDTMIGEYVIGGNRYRLRQLSLNSCLERYGLQPKEDLVGLMMTLGIDPIDVPQSWLLKYCERDVVACEELFRIQRKRLRELSLEHINYQRNLVTPALADIEAQGMQLDVKKIAEIATNLENEYNIATQDLRRFADGRDPSSSQQMCEFVYEVLRFRVPRDYKNKPMLTPKGGYSVAADVVKKLRAKTDRQRQFLDKYTKWRDLNSDVTKYLRKFQQCCVEAGGRLHGLFNQCSTATHRLSSSGFIYSIQLQNLNRLFKPLFIARHDGWSVGEMDGSQLEFRGATELASDVVAMLSIVSKEDVHKLSAETIFGELNADTRQDAKPHTFKPLYGGNSGTDRERAYYKAFRDKYSQIYDTQTEWTHTVAKNKELVTPYGLRFYWPDAKKSPSGYVSYTTNIFNYPIQGFATAEIIPINLVCAWHRMRYMKSFIVNTVHDSIIGEIHPDEKELWHEVAKQCMIEDVYHVMSRLYNRNMAVPLGAGVMIGRAWADKEAKENEVSYQAPEYLWIDEARKRGMIK